MSRVSDIQSEFTNGPEPCFCLNTSVEETPDGTRYAVCEDCGYARKIA